MTKILLAGIGSLLNYGCEGIVRGTYRILQEKFSDFNLTVAVSNVEQSRELLADLPDIKLVEQSRRFSPYRIYKGLLRRIGIGNGSPLRMRYALVKQYDIFLSGGGDNICQAPDGTLYPLTIDLLKMGGLAQKYGKKYFLWGASVGPFSTGFEHFIARELCNADGVIVRERLAYEYLQKLIAPEKLHKTADPAFAFDFPCHAVRQNAVGLNLSPLAVELSSGNLPLFCNQMAAWVKKHQLDKIILIPHVMSSKTGSQNDYKFLEKIQTELYRNLFSEQVELLPEGIGAKKTKEVIATLELLIASRMHCCIAGCSLGVPTLFVTYSPKGKGMNEYVYQGHLESHEINEIYKPIFFEALSQCYDRRGELREYLLQSKSRFMADALKNGDFLVK